METIKSAIYFFWGIIKRFYIWLYGLLLDPFDLYQKYIDPIIQKRYGVHIDMPSKWGLLIFILLIILCLLGSKSANVRLIASRRGIRTAEGDTTGTRSEKNGVRSLIMTKVNDLFIIDLRGKTVTIKDLTPHSLTC